MRFTAWDTGSDIVAETDDPKLRGITWWWSGGAYIDYGLAGSEPVDCLNVFDYKLGRVPLPFTADALVAYLESTYADPDEVEAARQCIAHG